VNALSVKMVAEVVKSGELYRVEFERGATIVPFVKVGKTDRARGRVLYFYPDPEIFKETVEFDYKWVVSYLRHQAYLTKGLYTIGI
jgi:DNA gyrase subunit B